MGLSVSWSVNNQLVLVSGIYLLAWSPYAIFCMKMAFGMVTEVHPIVFALLEFCMKSSVVLNPIMHISYTQKYRYALLIVSFYLWNGKQSSQTKTTIKNV